MKDVLYENCLNCPVSARIISSLELKTMFNRTIITSGDMAEAFNEHFTNIAQVLAQEAPAAEHS